MIAISDDQSWFDSGAYGAVGVETPAAERIAAAGVRFTQAFSAGPQCTVSRAALLTGRNIWQNREAGTHWSNFPRDLGVFPELLQGAGYDIGVTGKGWGPGEWKVSGWPHNPAGPEYNEIRLSKPTPYVNDSDYAANFEAFLETRDPSRPFYFWYGSYEPHLPHEEGSGVRAGKDPRSIRVPDFMEDTPEARRALLDYYLEIEWFDQHLGRMLDALERAGELENTLVIVTSDNGDFQKGTLYDSGSRVPFIVSWPARVPGGRVVDDLISFIDVAPTLLESAGLPRHDQMTGRSFLDLLTSTASGRLDPRRTHVLLGQERGSHQRFDNLGYPQRAIRTDRFLYIRNLKPERWPDADPRLFLWGPEGDDSVDEFQVIPPDWRKRRAEELYDVITDPWNRNDLSDQVQYLDVMEELRLQLEEELTAQRDPRMLGCGDIFESYPRYGPMREGVGGFAEHGRYNTRYSQPGCGN